MRAITSLSRVVLFLAFLGLISASRSTDAQEKPTEEKAANAAAASQVDAKQSEDGAIRASAEAFAKAYNTGDAKGIAALFAEDADYIDEDGTPVRGRSAIEKDYTDLFADGAERSMKISVRGVRFVTPDVAIEDGCFDITPEPAGAPCDRKYTAVHVKRDGKWLITSVRDMRVVKTSHYEHLKELEWLIGDWVDEGPDSLVATSCRWSDNKNYVIRKYTVRVAGVHSQEGVQRIGWDPASGRIRSWLFDSDGGYADAYWTKDGDRWVIEGKGVLSDGTKTSATNVLTKVSDDQFTFTSQNRTINGQPEADVDEITIVRKPPEVGAK